MKNKLERILQITKDIIKGKKITKIPSQTDKIEENIVSNLHIINEQFLELKKKEDFRDIYDSVPLSIWIEDFSDVKKYIDRKREDGIENFKEYFANNFKEVKKCVSLIKIQDVNKHTLKVYKASSKEELKTNLSTIFLEESYPTIEDQLISIANNKKKFFGESINKTLKNDKLNIYLAWVAQDDNYSKVIVSSIDISNRKKIEHSLEESKEKFRKITSSAKDAIIMIDSRGKVNFWNEAAEKIFGYKKNEIINKDLHRIIADKKYHDQIDKGLEKFSHNGKGAIIDDTIEMEAIHKDGKVFPVEISVTATKINNEWYGLSIIRDITKRKLNEEELKRHKEQISLINNILRHDITNNLSAIRSAIDIYFDERNDEILNEIISYIDKSTDLIHKMRNHETRIQTDKLQIFDTKEIYSYVKQISALDIKTSGQMKIFADDSIYSVFDNLINNAVEHGGATEIEIRTSTKNDLAEIKIIDNGKGIPNKIKDKIFNKGFTSVDSNKHSGIGLFIVKQTVEKWGGFIIFEDNKPHGSIFKLYVNKIR